MKKYLARKYNQHEKLIKNVFWRALQTGAKQGTSFLMFFISAYYLSPQELGIFSYMMATIGLLLIVCDFGFSQAVTKYITELKVKKSENLDKVLFSVSAVIIGLASLVSIFVILFGKNIFKEYDLILYLLPYLYFAPLSSVADGVYRGLQKFKKLSIINLIIAAVSLLASYLLIKNYKLTGAIISQNLLVGLLTIALLFSSEIIKFKFDKDITLKILRYAFTIGFINILYFLYTRADILILKSYNYTAEIGYYEVVNRVFKLIYLPFTIIGQVIAPNITQIYTQKNYVKVKNKLIKYVTIFVSFGIVMAPALYLGLPLLIHNYFNKYFTSATISMLKILSILVPLRITATVVNQSHTLATGNAHFNMWAMIPAGIGNVVLDYVFINKYGFMGVIYSTAICILFSNVFFIFLYFLKINKLAKNS